MAKSNPNKNYSFGDRFQKFIKKVINFAIRARSTDEIDTGPTDIFDGERGELLVKFGEKIFYRKNDSNQFVNLSDEYTQLVEQNKYILNKGINKNTTWQKNSDLGYKQWEFLGYFSPICDVDCCVTGSGDPQ